MKKNTMLAASLTLAALLTGCTATPVPAPTESAAAVQAPAPAPTANPDPVTPIPEPAREPVLEIATVGSVPWTDTWEPPTWQGTYQVVDDAHGFPEVGGTRFLITHARALWTGERSEGNDWVERLTDPGDIVSVDGERYAIDAVVTTAKTDIAAVPIWEHSPGRVVLITCVPRWEGSAVENRIVILEKEGGN